MCPINSLLSFQFMTIASREANGDGIQTTHLHPQYAPAPLPCSPSSTTTPTTAELSRQLEEVVISDVDDKQRAR